MPKPISYARVTMLVFNSVLCVTTDESQRVCCNCCVVIVSVIGDCDETTCARKYLCPIWSKFKCNKFSLNGYTQCTYDSATQGPFSWPILSCLKLYNINWFEFRPSFCLASAQMWALHLNVYATSMILCWKYIYIQLLSHKMCDPAR